MIINQLGYNDKKYLLTCIDDYTAFKAACCMKSKSETLMYCISKILLSTSERNL